MMSDQPSAVPLAERMRTRADLIASMRGEAARSDGQVGIVLAGAAAGLGFVVSTGQPAGALALVLWWAGLAAGIGGVLLLGTSLCPAIPRRLAVPAAAWHAWHVRAADQAGLLTDVLDNTPRALAAADRQTAALAGIVTAKWQRNRDGLRLLGVALVLLAAAGIAVTA